MALAAKTKEQQAASLAAMGEGQQKLVSTAIKSPEDLAQEATVTTIDPDTIGAEIAESTGDAGATTDITAKTITGESLLILLLILQQKLMMQTSH